MTSPARQTRFAPTPSGHLHIGHAYSALLNQWAARQYQKPLLLRIEDIDRNRCKPGHVDNMLEDLNYLGLEWAEPVRRQSDNMDFYREMLASLAERGLVYKSYASRAALRAAFDKATAKGEFWPLDPEGSPCFPPARSHRALALEAQAGTEGAPANLRLDMELACRQVKALTWHEFVLDSARPMADQVFAACGFKFRFHNLPEFCKRAKLPSSSHADSSGTANAFQEINAEPQAWGDVILGRKDTPASYHLAVVMDDALQNIGHVIRGQDLFHATAIHRLLQELLGLPAPLYSHHRLIMDCRESKLSKSAGAISLRQLRQSGMDRQALRAAIGWPDMEQHVLPHRLTGCMASRQGSARQGMSENEKI